jgi:hypothetical protein
MVANIAACGFGVALTIGGGGVHDAIAVTFADARTPSFCAIVGGFVPPWRRDWGSRGARRASDTSPTYL